MNNEAKWGPMHFMGAAIIVLAVSASLVFVLEGLRRDPVPRYALAIHGGAGTITRANLGAEREAAIHEDLADALRIGEAVLKDGGAAIDAVQAAVVRLEDSPHFNAGLGAVFTADGHNELDAAIMNGADLDAGAVAAARGVKNPIKLARAVMEHSPHVMLSGDGASSYAREHGLQMVPPDYYHTDHRWQQLQRARSRAAEQADKHGTVGAVALDMNGHLAAATSTGGMTNKRFGRIGDSPIIGAGTWADNRSCAVSATGHGEYFIRANVAASICGQMLWRHTSLAAAAEDVIWRQLPAMGGTGGIIAIDKDGKLALTFNTPGMYRGYVRAGEQPITAIYKNP